MLNQRSINSEFFLIGIRYTEYLRNVRFALMPRFRNLHHFEYVLHISFNDGSKYEDIAKVGFNHMCSTSC